MHPKPSVEARLNALTAFNEVCTLIVSALENSADGHGTIRIMINAQQQILLLKLLLNAAKSGDAKDFEKARASLSNQAKI
ncbi:MAG: hypothetical protein JWQ07_5097 [Ramlibacter sp.]|nr:hypothetical protein [Ramlibacter sp.]